MKHCFAKRQTTLKSVLLIMLLMFTSLAVNAQSAESTGKYKPYVYISKTGYGITANGEPATYLQDMAFIEPSVLVYEGEDNKALISTVSTFPTTSRVGRKTAPRERKWLKRAKLSVLTPLRAHA